MFRLQHGCITKQPPTNEVKDIAIFTHSVNGRELASIHKP